MLTVKNFNQRLQPISNLTATAGSGQVTLTWSDPSDTPTSIWASTKLVRKTGSAPSSSTDGTLVITETTRNQYSSSGYADTGLTNGTTYYYKAFVVDSGGNEIASNSVSETPLQPVHSDMQGPCSIGYHVALFSEWSSLSSMVSTLSLNAQGVETYLKLPKGGSINYSSGSATDKGTKGYYASANTYGNDRAIYASISNNYFTVSEYSYISKVTGFLIRPFKDTPVTPDSSWTKTYSGTGSAGIYHNSTLGLISISGNGTNWITIADKNLGATTVYNYGDTLSEANCGKYYQWGNNHGFPRTGSFTKTSTRVNAGTYGPGNYYDNSSFFRDGESQAWDSSNNNNLWGGVSQGTWTD